MYIVSSSFLFTPIIGIIENINILYAEKGTKFHKEKFLGYNALNIDNKPRTTAEKRSTNQLHNRRHNSFITIFYFIISPFIYQIEDNILNNLKNLFV